VAALSLAACAGGARAEAAIVMDPPPTVFSDQADYRPGATVTLRGSGWAPGESVHLRINDDAGSSWSRDVDVVADADGAITDSFSLPNWFVAEYSVTATGAFGESTTTAFTDGNLNFGLATVDQGAPAALSWTVSWENFDDTQCPQNKKDGAGSTSYTGDTLDKGGKEPGVGNKQSAKPTGATASGYVLDYWSIGKDSTVPATSAQVCATTRARRRSTRTSRPPRRSPRWPSRRPPAATAAAPTSRRG